MERRNHRADDQQPGASIQYFLQQLRHQHSHLHPDHTGDHGSPDGEAKSSAQSDVGAPTKNEGDSGALLERQTAGVPGNDEALQRAGRESARLPGADGHTVSNLDRALPGHTSNSTFDAREPRRPIQTSILMAPPGPPGDSAGELVPLAGPRQAGPDPCFPCTGGSLNVFHAKDDHHAGGGPETAVHQPYDAVDDAADVRILHDDVSEWTGIVLGDLQRCRNCDPGLRHRLGSVGVHGFSRPTLQGARCGSCAGVVGGGGDGNRCE